jgi:hypothetical protein
MFIQMKMAPAKKISTIVSSTFWEGAKTMPKPWENKQNKCTPG